LFRNKKKAGPPSIRAPAPAAAAKVGVPGTAAEILSLAIKSSDVGLHAYAFRWVLHNSKILSLVKTIKNFVSSLAFHQYSCELYHLRHSWLNIIEIKFKALTYYEEIEMKNFAGYKLG
jgi:hypothetical protein